MQSRLACIDCCPACCHRHHSCSGPAIAFTDGRAARSHRSTGNLSWSITPRDNDFINVDSVMLAKCPALRSCRPAVSSDGVINVMPTSHPHRLSAPSAVPLSTSSRTSAKQTADHIHASTAVIKRPPRHLQTSACRGGPSDKRRPKAASGPDRRENSPCPTAPPSPPAAKAQHPVPQHK